ncbi:hypothetical protein WIW49_12150 [Xanthomonas euroxanthea]
MQEHTSWFREFCDTYGSEHTYYNWFVYPNVNFCSVRGEHFCCSNTSQSRQVKPTTTCG